MNVYLNEDVQDRQCDIGNELPDLPGEQHPQHVVFSLDVHPAPAYRHFRGIIADLVQRQRCHSDGERNAPADINHKSQDQTGNSSGESYFIIVFADKKIICLCETK